VRVLITGSNGLLGQKIVERCIKLSISYWATSIGDNRNPECPNSHYSSLDVTNKEEIDKIFESFLPTHVIHTAAITNVDYCELNPEECQIVNTNAVSFLYQSAKEINAHFQLLSTDFVFDGSFGNYSENDTVNPLSHYAKSKVEAESILQNDNNYNNWSIVRTIIVYGTGHNLSRSNLISWVIESLKQNKEIKVVDDQFRAPTWAPDLAYACIEICLQSKIGIYHVCGPQTYSIYEIAILIAEYYNFPKEKIERISSEKLNQPAKRPPRTGFDLSKTKKEIGYYPKTIEETLNLI